MNFYYCTARHDNQVAWLSGPFATHQHALDDLPRVKALAEASGDPKADFAGYGTASAEVWKATHFPALHDIVDRSNVTGEWVTRCGLHALKDTRALPRGPKVGETFATFFTAGMDADVDCPGCRINLSAVGAWALSVMAARGATLREDTRYSINGEANVLYMPRWQMDSLAAAGLVRDGKLTPLGKSLAERNAK